MDPLELKEIMQGLSLPLALHDHWESINRAKRPFSAIEAIPAAPKTLKESKFGHYPCIPSGYPYPTGSDGNYLYPLAQINFSEFTPPEGFPTSGLLQFYIAANDDMGLDFKDHQNQANFRVLYFEEHALTQPQEKFDFLSEIIKNEYSPVTTPHQLRFSNKEDYFGANDIAGFNYQAILSEQPTETADKLINFIESEFSGCGHKIGGYAYFTQSDPRKFNKQFRDYILLFQLDMDDKIMWGGSGVGNFFIHPDALAKKDFSKVMYTWDCC